LIHFYKRYYNYEPWQRYDGGRRRWWTAW